MVPENGFVKIQTPNLVPESVSDYFQDRQMKTDGGFVQKWCTHQLVMCNMCVPFCIFLVVFRV